jgi:PAS domain S-box-containing protein
VQAITVIWSMIAGACVAFAVVNGLVWWQKREARQNGAFALLAAGAALLTLIELELLASTTIEHYAQWLGHYLLATSLMFVAIMLVCRYHVGAGRDLLGWLAVLLRALMVIVSESGDYQRLYFEVTRLEIGELLGQSVAVVSTKPGPLTVLGQLSLVLMTLYLVDAAATAWRNGLRQRALHVAYFALLIFLGGIWGYVSLWSSSGAPLIIAPLLLPVVVLMRFDLSSNVIRALELESRLVESERRLSLTADAARAGLWNIDLSTGRAWLTPRTRDMFLLSSTEGMHVADAAQIVHPEDRRRFRRMFLDEAGQLRTASTLEFRVLMPSGEIRWYESQGSAEPAAGAGGTMLMGATIDITTRKRAEEERLQRAQQIERLSRLAIMSELAATVAHELNQPLASMLSNAETALLLLERESPDIEEVRKVLTEIVAADERAAMIVQRFRSLLKSREPQLQNISLRDAVSGVLAFMRGDLSRRGVVVQWEPGEDPCNAMVDAVRFDQLLINLIINACDAMNTKRPEDRILALAVAQRGDAVVVDVRDSGAGLAQDLNTLLEPLYTTKSDSLGLGLVIARSVVDAHGGRLWATSNAPASGATFSFSIPSGGGMA